MKLSEIVANLKQLQATVSGFITDKATATADALAKFSANLSALETGAVAELTQAQADLATAKQISGATQTALEASQAQISAINTQLKEACAALNLEITGTLGQTSSGMITALQGAVSATLAKLQVDPGKVPSAVPTKAGEAPGKPKTATERCLAAKSAPITITK